MLLKVTAIKSAMKHHGGSVFGKKQMPGVETHHLRQSSERTVERQPAVVLI